MKTELVGALLVCAAGGVFASHEPYELDWPIKQQALTYQSCGCADDCWVAEVSDRQSRIFLGRLRCDCSTLFFYKPSPNPQSRVLGSCAPVNAAQRKPAVIAEKLMHLLPAD